MPYPYGTQNAPAVGLGLGGLPRRATPAAVVAATGPQILQRTGSVVTAATGFNDVSSYTFGRILGDSPGRAIFKYTFQDSGGNTNYAIGGVNYTDAGITSALNPINYGTTSNPWNQFNFSNSWSAGDSVYFCPTDGNVYRIFISSGSNLSSTTAKSSAIPSSGTLTVGGSSYAIYNSFSAYVVGDALASFGSCARKMSNGNVLIVQFATVGGSNIRAVGFVLDSAFNIVRSFPIVTIAGGNSTSVGRLLLVLPVANATDVFSVFVIAGSTGTSAWANSATFNAATGDVSITTDAATSVPDQNWLNTSTYTVGSGFVKITYNQGGVSTRNAFFKVNSDISVTGSSTTDFSFFNSAAATTMPTLRYYDPDFQDYPTLSNGGTQVDAPVDVTGTGQYTGFSPVLQQVTSLSYTSADATAVVSALSLKSLIIQENDPSSSAQNAGYGPTPLVRVGANAFICAYRDQDASTRYRLNTQLLRGT